MALFDKLKEKVNKVVDVDKLKAMANKTINFAKHEDAQVEDPAVKEQERLEQERVLKEQEEQKKQEKEKNINDFLSSVDLDKELDYIFGVLEKSGASASNFEKGVGHLLSKTETTVTKADVMPILKKALFARVFSDTECTVAKAVATDYFVQGVIDSGLLSLYVRFTVSREKGSYAFMEEPFIKALYGVAGYADNYLHSRLEQGNYRAMTPDDFISIIEDSDTLKSYTDTDPFAAEEMRKKWAQDLCKAPFEMLKTSNLSELLKEEEYLGALYYFAYTTLCKDQKDTSENVCVAKIACVYLEHLRDYYSRFKR